MQNKEVVLRRLRQIRMHLTRHNHGRVLYGFSFSSASSALSLHVRTYPPVCVSVSAHLLVQLSVCIYPSAYICLSVCLSAYLCHCVSVCVIACQCVSVWLSDSILDPGPKPLLSLFFPISLDIITKWADDSKHDRWRNHSTSMNAHWWRYDCDKIR